MVGGYKTGREGERKIAAELRKSGFKVTLAPGSRGAADVLGSKGQHKVAVQVKTSRGGKPKKPTAEEIRRLRRFADRTGAVPAVASVQLPGTRAKRRPARARRK